jgi:hypothetical protein
LEALIFAEAVIVLLTSFQFRVLGIFQVLVLIILLHRDQHQASFFNPVVWHSLMVTTPVDQSHKEQSAMTTPSNTSAAAATAASIPTPESVKTTLPQRPKVRKAYTTKDAATQTEQASCTCTSNDYGTLPSIHTEGIQELERFLLTEYWSGNHDNVWAALEYHAWLE